MLLKGLPPIVGPDSRVLILGSFPSEASLAASGYYAHRQNQFWRILAALYELPFPEMDHAERRRVVPELGLAIWDVYGSCERAGSLDAAIRNARPNDFRELKRLAPSLGKACFNGQTAGRFAPVLTGLGFSTAILPSTSPANASWSFERKLAAWREGLSVPS